jgi:hypothetical protein
MFHNSLSGGLILTVSGFVSTAIVPGITTDLQQPGAAVTARNVMMFQVA